MFSKLSHIHNELLVVRINLTMSLLEENIARLHFSIATSIARTASGPSLVHDLICKVGGRTCLCGKRLNVVTIVIEVVWLL